MADVYYQLFLLYSRWNKPAEADAYRALMAQQYPDDAMTRLINDPDFERNARFGKAIEDSLYTVTYEPTASTKPMWWRETLRFPPTNSPTVPIVRSSSSCMPSAKLDMPTAKTSWQSCVNS